MLNSSFLYKFQQYLKKKIHIDIKEIKKMIKIYIFLKYKDIKIVFCEEQGTKESLTKIRINEK